MEQRTGPAIVQDAEQALRRVVATLIDLDLPEEKTAAYRALAAFLRSVAGDLETLARVEESLLELACVPTEATVARNRAARLPVMVRGVFRDDL